MLDILRRPSELFFLDSSPTILVDDQTHVHAMILLPDTSSRSQFELNCSFYGHPLPNLNLLKDGRVLPLNESEIEILPTGDMLLRHLITISSTEDAGLYECVATNEFGSISSSKHISIRHQKPYIQPLFNQTVQSENLFTVACYASGQPHLHLQWIDQKSHRILNASMNSPLLWSSAERVSKILTCRAENLQGEASRQVFIQVKTPVHIFYHTPNRTVRLHDRLFVQCSAQGESPLELKIIGPKSKQHQWVEMNATDHKNGSLIIDQMDMSDSGTYVCSAKNQYSSQQVPIEILVQTVPDRVGNLSIEKFDRIIWSKPFDGHSPIYQYLLRFRFRQGLLSILNSISEKYHCLLSRDHFRLFMVRRDGSNDQ